MSNLAHAIQPEVYFNRMSNIISFDDLRSNKEANDFGSENDAKLESNKAGEDTEVFAFKTDEEIKAMIDVFDKHIEEADTPTNKQIAYRNKMLFIIGINVGLRASDLRELTWDFFFEEKSDGSIEFRKSYSLQPKKTRKKKKFVRLYFNETTKTIINEYIEKYPIENIKGYVFESRKGDDPISVRSIWRIIKSTAKEAGIKQNIGSHSLRKSWAFHCWRNAEDKNKALIVLQNCFNHSSSITTAKYIGIMDDEIEEMYNSINLGLDFI